MSEPMSDTTGNQAFKAARGAADWTQEELVERFEVQARSLGLNLGLSVRQVRRWESAQPPWPRAPYRRVLQELFGLSADQLGFIRPRRGTHSERRAGGFPTLGGTTGSAREADTVYRRDFLRAAAASAALGSATHSLPLAERIGAALLLQFGRDARAEPVAAAALRCDVDRARDAFQGCHYARLGSLLPGLLSTSEVSVDAADEANRASMWTLYSEALHVTTSMLLKVGRTDLALISADRAMNAAKKSQEPLAIAGAARILAHASFAAGHPKTAAALATKSAEHLDDPSQYNSAAYQSVQGALLLRGAIAAARGGDRSTTSTLLGEADVMARRLGVDANHRWTAFGPTNVKVHRVATAVELGDAGQAIAIARTIQWSAIKVVERQAALWVDLACAFGQWGKDEEALRAVLTAERLAPEEVCSRPAVRTLVEELWFRRRRSPGRDLLALAHRTGAAL